MKNLLIITFDIIYPNEPLIPYPIGSIISSLKSDAYIRESYNIHYKSFNIYGGNLLSIKEIIEILLKIVNLNDINIIALGCYYWSERYINPLIFELKKNGFNGKIILGGYQIQPKTCIDDYPLADYYIVGYAELSIIKILKNTEEVNEKIIQNNIDLNNIPSPYLTEVIPISNYQGEVLLETKRGCPYRCTFCAHKDIISHKIYKNNLEKVFMELLFMKNHNVKQINIVDPIFNMGNDYIEILKEMVRININSFLTIQTRFELVKGDIGKTFLELCSQLNVRLEFGLQTINIEENIIINRKNNIDQIKKTISELNNMAIKYEISLIYGLPNQTISSFKESVKFANDSGCQNIKAFPLMLLKGTELFERKEEFGFKEGLWGEYNLPVVMESNSFSFDDWKLMEEIASSIHCL